MYFGAAFELLRGGKAIKRSCWDVWLEIRELPAHRESVPDTPLMTNFIVAIQADGKYSRWYPFDQDLLADDWEEAQVPSINLVV